MAVAVQRLGPGDLALLRAFNALMGEVFDEQDTYTGIPPGDAWCRALLAREEVILLAALDGDRVVGALGGYVLRKFEQERSEIFIYDLAVAADRRREGIATALIEETRVIARDTGTWTIFVQGDVGDEPALALYRKLASQEIVAHHFDLSPWPGSPDIARRAPLG